MHGRLLIAAICGLAVQLVLAPASAAADGSPVALTAGPAGVRTPGGELRFTTRFVRGNRTRVIARRSDGQVVRSTVLRGRFAVPAVAYDGTPGGLSADGSTLVLTRVTRTFMPRHALIPILDARRLRLRRTLRLPGNFGFDALSPDARTLYLTEVSRRDPADYQVRAYDLARRRLDPKPVLDPAEPGEEMRGSPMTRATSPDGRWAYTLYDGGGHHEPFIHALDTVKRRTACIDLPMLPRAATWRTRLGVSPSGDAISVATPKRLIATVSYPGFAVRDARGGPKPRSVPAESGGAGGGWAIAGGGVLLAGALGLTLWRRRRPQTS